MSTILAPDSVLTVSLK